MRRNVEIQILMPKAEEDSQQDLYGWSSNKADKGTK